MDQNQSIPPSPAPSGQEAYLSGFAQLENFNKGVGATSFPRDLQDTVHAHSQPASRTATPMNQGQPGVEYDGLPLPYPQGGMSNNYGYPHAPLSHESSPYAQMPEAYSTPATSPPTPSDMMRTRSGTAIPRDPTPKVLGTKGARVEKKPPPKKKKERVKAVKRIPKLEKPLSAMDVESKALVADIEAYVNRSAEIRKTDVNSGKNPGKIKRPMNAFMLYRKAYQNRAKEWCSQHNHQVVSQVCGDSWPLEKEETRNQFTEWARIERDNHQKTFPDYKFTPSKPQKPKYPGGRGGGGGGGGGVGRGGGGRAVNGEDSEEELQEYDWTRPDSRNTKTPSSDLDGEWAPPRMMPFAPQAYPAMGGSTNPMGPPMPYPHSSSFEMSNPGRPLPAPYDPRASLDRYYQTQVQHGHMYPGMPVQDVTMRQTPSPGMVYPNGHRQIPPPPMHLGLPPHSQQLNMMHYHHAPQAMEYHGLPFVHQPFPQAHENHLQPLLPPPPQESQIDPILQGLGNAPFDDDGVLLDGFAPAQQAQMGESEQAGRYVPENPFMGNIGDPGADDDAPYLRGNWEVVEDDTGFDLDTWVKPE